MGTKNNPGNFDCYGNADPDEPMFILLARDAAAPCAVEKWIEYREALIRLGIKPETDHVMLDEARSCAAAMREWREKNRPPLCIPGDKLRDVMLDRRAKHDRAPVTPGKEA